MYVYEPLTTSPVAANGACGKGRQYTHRCQDLNRRDGVQDQLSTSSFDASIKGDELDSTVQLPNFRLVVA